MCLHMISWVLWLRTLENQAKETSFVPASNFHFGNIWFGWWRAKVHHFRIKFDLPENIGICCSTFLEMMINSGRNLLLRVARFFLPALVHAFPFPSLISILRWRYFGGRRSIVELLLNGSTSSCNIHLFIPCELMNAQTVKHRSLSLNMCDVCEVIYTLKCFFLQICV